MNKHTRGQRVGCLICIVSAALMVVLTVAVVRYAATHLRPAEEATDMTCPVVSAAAPKTVDIQGFCAPAKAAPDMTCPVSTVPVLETYTDGDAPVPEWWNPDEPMAAVWEEPKPGEFGFMAGDAESYRQVGESNNEADSEDSVDSFGASGQVAEEPQKVISTDHFAEAGNMGEAHPPVGIAPGGVDWNIETEIVGWDGHRMAVWEMDLYSRILYKEFWGTSRECCEAGADSILRLWESGYFSDTMFGTLSAVTETGAWVYSTYPFVWETVYDPQGLADMRQLCEERFVDGPSWAAEFFQLYSYPEWAVPMYELDGVYFSTSPYLH